MLASVSAFGQLTHTVNNGEYKLTYGKTADWSIYDPMGAPTIYLHVWLPKQMVTTTKEILTMLGQTQFPL